MILMISSLTEKGREEKLWTCVMRKVLICFWACIFFLSFNVSVGVAEEEEKKEEKTVLEEITVIGTPYSNPVTPLNTRYGTQYNLVTEEKIK